MCGVGGMSRVAGQEGGPKAELACGCSEPSLPPQRGSLQHPQPRAFAPSGLALSCLAQGQSLTGPATPSDGCRQEFKAGQLRPALETAIALEPPHRHASVCGCNLTPHLLLPGLFLTPSSHKPASEWPSGSLCCHTGRAEPSSPSRP